MDNELISRFESEDGTTLIETMIAVGMMIVVMAGMLPMVLMSTTITENHGHLEARTTEYAQDKMEQLLALAYGDVLTDTITPPGASGSGLAIGGSIDPAAPVDTYVDWLTAGGDSCGGGTAQPAPSATCKGGWFYERVWAVSCASVSMTPAVACVDSPGAGIKQVTVVTRTKTALGGALIPKSLVTTIKTSQF